MARKKVRVIDSWAPGIGARLRFIREGCGATQGAVSTASGVSASTLRRCESGLAEPKRRTVQRLVAVLGGSADYLLTGSPVPNEEEIAALRLQWDLERLSPPESRAALRLANGLLGQMLARLKYPGTS